jgi:hypothetical protein
MRPPLSAGYKQACTFCGDLYTFLPQCSGVNCEARCCASCLDPETSTCAECAEEARSFDAFLQQQREEERDRLAQILLAGARIGVGAVMGFKS